jgi:tetratricopeptide (TPR) repeat protein
MRNYLIGALIGVGACLFACSNPTEKSSSSNSKTPSSNPADSLIRKIDSLTNLLKEDPSQADWYIQRAEYEILLGKFPEAYNDGLDALIRDSTNEKTWVRFGNIAYTTGNYLRAEESYERALRINPQSIDALSRLAEFYLIQKKYTESMSYANKIIEIDDQTAKAYFVKGWIYKENGDTGKASTSFQTAVELDPNYYDAFIQLGEMSFNAKLPVALDYFNSALAIDPKSTEALYFKGTFLQGRNRFDEALEVYKQISAINPNFEQAYFNSGYIKLTAENKPDSAITWFTKAIEVNPQYAEAYYNRGYCKELLGQRTQASADYKLALGIKPSYSLASEALKRVQ